MTALGIVIPGTPTVCLDTAADCLVRALRIYGPDGTSRHVDARSTMVRVLARLTPEDSYDQQPVAVAGGDACLLFDGRIDNRDALLSALTPAGTDPRTLADSALVALAVDHWGLAETLPRLCGPFALIHWDPGRSVLTLARDALGYRPLFFTRQPGFIAAASMPKGLHALPEMPREMDTGAVAERFLQYPRTDTRTVFADVQRVPPGHVVELSATGQTVRRWRDLDTLTIDHSRSFDENLRALDTALTQAVTAQLRRIGGIGGQLSSGLDSPLVMGMALHHLPAGTAYQAFTAAPRDPSILPQERLDWLDESRRARAIASLFPSVRHTVIPNDAAPLARIVARYTHAQDAPVQLPLHTRWFDAIGHQARRNNIRVILTGLSGNLSVSAGLGLVEPGLLRTRGLIAWQMLLARLVLRRKISVKAWLRRWVERLPAPLATGVLKASGRWRQMNEISRLSEDTIHRYDLTARQAEWSGDFVRSDRLRSTDIRVLAYDLLDLGPYLKALLAETGVDFRDPYGDLRVLRLALTIPHEQFVLPDDRSFGRALFSRYVSADLADKACTLSGRQNADMAASALAAEADLAETFARGASGPTVFKPVPSDDLSARLQALRSETATLNTRTFGPHADRVVNLLRQYATQTFINGFNRRNTPEAPADPDP